MIQVGIIGGAGYTAGELIRLLMFHQEAEINFVYSTSNAGNKISKVHQDLEGSLDLKFTDTINPNVDVLFLCLGHGNSVKFLSANTFSDTTKIIDLGNDFRLEKDKFFDDKTFIYGLPELQKEAIQKADYIANPGCFATAIQLALLPLAKNDLIKSDVHVNAVTGSTGAGTSLTETTHFTWRDNNFSYYKPFTHQHLGEINQSVKQLQESFSSEIVFMPNRGNFSRGIFATVYTNFDGSLEEAKNLYKAFYQEAKFTFVSDEDLHLKQVVNTNKCLIHLHKHNNKLLITSIIDNLLKGASGQAIQNMNLMFGLEEAMGLQLKATYF
ncbi:MAG: N-acetyl-gamma-glutamyl-phosphate reductase [Flavobacteriales bacterium]|nr:N-acetyl-gamma-glutamyl-phosphate reductase [Flavobacteriia bacterium]NCP05197.1 N-acetyl-gamma-glutamyl-phosphate reductase [Flavobacteriales bacterium]PIV94041.1 MAG: N-acetyl-gamma-glutamyl-phosphate reductase [Flavobacteriaceae bacterium CG17_big_fil_post_rev_8_21_14_2_50_33_15]PIY10945.1 MAG: N-acetyl-gamma-glutamyl-phosphate reductase [Flavobacteriaceae bacterium CG_4_10_14_3_um_filter_33_47]PJB20028.1 MAG: N-acetyl-gamma-glutamyl-phosphate reductase [Flavobacteriaceae bacterium CG_4_9